VGRNDTDKCTLSFCFHFNEEKRRCSLRKCFYDRKNALCELREIERSRHRKEASGNMSTEAMLWGG